MLVLVFGERLVKISVRIQYRFRFSIGIRINVVNCIVHKAIAILYVQSYN